MVTRRTPRRISTVRPAARPKATPVAAPMARPSTADMRVAFGVASHKVLVAGTAARRFARASMREMTIAARDLREPMGALWRTLRLAGRHIARDAMMAWREVVPQATARPARRAAA